MYNSMWRGISSSTHPQTRPPAPPVAIIIVKYVMM